MTDEAATVVEILFWMAVVVAGVVFLTWLTG